MIDHNIPRSELMRMIDELCIKSRDKEILKRRLCDCTCFEPLAEEFGLSVQRVKQIVYKSQTKLFNKH